ncbi:hypothetical protein CVT26_008939 [Gymnopilus dilepis]|uniref:Acetohydroxy-acid reductoisomerase n=1 Tax=Gymnopilus dilepis TaxID=231916 RepID=A0A409YRS5_9AGAR|nr:hypothetical protein CVT26_008939 [Gymnopilus dilepis]
MPSAKIYYDSDADLSLLKDKQIVFLGFGNQGAAQAQNLRDSGIPNEKILIANRADSYAEDAKSKGFIVEHDFEKAAVVADVVFLLIPDQAQPKVFNEKFVPNLKATATIVIASGYNVFFKRLSFNPQQDVVMVAPRHKGKGYPCFVSVEQNGTGAGLAIALALSRAIGATKAGAIASSAYEETAMDLMAEQALWPNIIMLFREAFSVLKEAGCSDEALCYEMWMSKEPAEIFERAAEDGFIGQLKHHSIVSQYGQLKGALSLDGAATRAHFKDVLYNQILNGKFADHLSKLEPDLEKDDLQNPLNQLYAKAEESELVQAEKRVRARLADLLNDQMEIDRSPNRHSSRNLSTDTLRTRRSHRSTSRDRERRDRRKDRDDLDERRHSRDRGSDRGYRDRSRDRHRDHDRDRRRDREGDRGHRSGRHDGHDSRHSRRDRDRDRERDRDDKDRDRRRKRGDDYDGSERDYDERAKRKRSEVLDDGPPPRRDSPHSVRSGDRRRSDRPPLDPRDEFDDPRSRKQRQKSVDDEDRLSNKSPPPPGVRRASPTYEEPFNPDEPKEDDSEARSVFVSQLAARLTARDLGYFFEDKLGEGTVMDSRIVTDRLSRRSKGSLNLPPGVTSSHGSMQLYVGSLHFNLTESDIKQVFEPFGELEFVDLHRDPMTGRSKGYAFIQYKRAEDARMALEQMEGFELAGRTLRVNTVHEKGTVKYTQQDSLDEAGGGNLNAASRQALMQKLARTETARALPEPAPKPNIPQTMTSRSVLLKNMFNPEEETERDWDKDLAEDVKGECESKYGPVTAIKVEKDTQGEIYVKFDAVESAKKAVQGLNGRYFGGRQISAVFISDALMQAHI